MITNYKTVWYIKLTDVSLWNLKHISLPECKISKGSIDAVLLQPINQTWQFPQPPYIYYISGMLLLIFSMFTYTLIFCYLTEYDKIWNLVHVTTYCIWIFQIWAFSECKIFWWRHMRYADMGYSGFMKMIWTCIQRFQNMHVCWVFCGSLWHVASSCLFMISSVCYT